MPIKAFVVMFLAGAAAGVFGAFKLMKPVEHETVVERVVTHIHTVVAPDGTKTTDTVKHENSIVEAAPKSIVTAKNWAVGAGYSTKSEYVISVDRRILGDFWVTGSASAGQAAIGLKYEF